MIKEYRIKKGFTQEQLAEKLGLSTRQLQRIEKNEIRTTIETLRKIKWILNIPDEVMAQIFKEEKKIQLVYCESFILSKNDLLFKYIPV